MINIKAIKKSEFAQNILKMFSGAIVSQIIVVIGSLILARLYSPEQFGELSLFISIVSILSILATVRYENTLIIIKQNYLIKYMLGFLYISSSLFILGLFLVLLSLSSDTLIYLKIDDFYPYIPIAILIYALFQISTNLNVREKNFFTIAKSKVLMAFIALSIQIFFYYLNFELGLIYGYILGYFMALFILYKNISNPFSSHINKIKIVSLLKRYSYFVKHALPADFINNLASNITPILIVVWFDMKIAGLYFLGYRIVNLPLQLISVSVGKVYFQKASYIYNTNKSLLYNFTKRIVTILFSIIIIPLLLLFFYSDSLIGFVLGDDWTEAGVYVSILTIMFLFRTMFSPISTIAEISKKVYITLYFSIFILFSTISSLYIGYLNNDFYLAIILLSITTSFGYLFLLIYFMKYLKGVSK